jgi:hypothetical protein
VFIPNPDRAAEVVGKTLLTAGPPRPGKQRCVIYGICRACEARHGVAAIQDRLERELFSDRS